MTPAVRRVTPGAEDAPGFLPISVALQVRLAAQFQSWCRQLADWLASEEASTNTTNPIKKKGLGNKSPSPQKVRGV
jgi:hypothetical protein